MSRVSTRTPGFSAAGHKIGRPSKGRRGVVYIRVPNSVLLDVNKIVDSSGENVSDTVSALTVIGLRHRSEFDSGCSELHQIPVVNRDGELQLADATDTSRPVERETIWSRMPLAVVNAVERLTVETRRKKSDVAAALLIVGLRYKEDFDSALLELRSTAAQHANGQNASQEELNMAI